MSTWNVYTLNGFGTWILDSTIPRPHRDIVDALTHNQQKRKLADGSDVFFTPESRTTKQIIGMAWLNQEKAFVDQIKNWMNDHEYLKIETHLSGYDFIGRFVSIEPVWLSGVNETWEISANFEQME